jgi:hypothetical protein
VAWFALGAGLVGEKVGLGDHPGATKATGRNSTLAHQKADPAGIDPEPGGCLGDGQSGTFLKNQLAMIFQVESDFILNHDDIVGGKSKLIIHQSLNPKKPIFQLFENAVILLLGLALGDGDRPFLVAYWGKSHIKVFACCVAGGKMAFHFLTLL